MDDGSKGKSSVVLHTESFTFEEVCKLIAMLHYQFNLDCTIQKHKNNQYKIYIKKSSFNTFKSLILPHMTPSMLYKLDL